MTVFLALARLFVPVIAVVELACVSLPRSRRMTFGQPLRGLAQGSLILGVAVLLVGWLIGLAIEHWVLQGFSSSGAVALALAVAVAVGIPVLSSTADKERNGLARTMRAQYSLRNWIFASTMLAVLVLVFTSAVMLIEPITEHSTRDARGLLHIDSLGPESALPMPGMTDVYVVVWALIVVLCLAWAVASRTAIVGRDFRFYALLMCGAAAALLIGELAHHADRVADVRRIAAAGQATTDQRDLGSLITAYQFIAALTPLVWIGSAGLLIGAVICLTRGADGPTTNPVVRAEGLEPPTTGV